ncbi:MAG: dual specificity protein phosphatase family protein [Candidatus Harrisonbacteria bacterium]|nr:dual specificity protein phosphatase family protein [Candidatus Harrisonbacteria bacterium]
MKKHDKLSFEYSKIAPQIYIGTNLCCTTHFNKALLKKGIHADLSLEEKKIDAPFGAEFYLWIPVKNHLPPTPKQFSIGVAFIHHVLKSGEKIYVHCEHGHGRAPTLVAAYLALNNKLSAEKAVELIKIKRSRAHPNNKQIAAVKRFVQKNRGMLNYK